MENKYQNYNPPTGVDILLYTNTPEGIKILVIERKNNPVGLALPGGFQEKGHTLEQTAVKECEEETGYIINEDGLELIGVMSDPNRDPRLHVNSVSFSYEVTDETKHTGQTTFDDADAPQWVLPEDVIGKLVLGHDSVVYLWDEQFGVIPHDDVQEV